jgi:hypothetical protein
MGLHKSLSTSDFRTQSIDASERNQCDNVRAHQKIGKEEEMAPPVATALSIELAPH